LEVSNKKPIIGSSRRVRGEDMGELSRQHRVEVPCPAGDEGVCRRIVP
jgi:hypothetical protein